MESKGTGSNGEFNLHAKTEIGRLRIQPARGKKRYTVSSVKPLKLVKQYQIYTQGHPPPTDSYSVCKYYFV